MQQWTMHRKWLQWKICFLIYLKEVGLLFTYFKIVLERYLTCSLIRSASMRHSVMTFFRVHNLFLRSPRQTYVANRLYANRLARLYQRYAYSFTTLSSRLWLLLRLSYCWSSRTVVSKLKTNLAKTTSNFLDSFCTYSKSGFRLLTV